MVHPRREPILQPAPAPEPPVEWVDPPAAWIHTVRRYARIAMWLLPVHAGLLLYGILSQRELFGAAAPRPWLAIAGAASGLIGIAALAGLLAGTRGRRWTAAGLVAAVVGLAALLPTAGQDVIVRSTAAGVGLGASALLALAWILLGLAVLRSKVLNAVDGALLIAAGPAAYLSGLYSPLFPAIGAALLLAAACGLAATAARLMPPS